MFQRSGDVRALVLEIEVNSRSARHLRERETQQVRVRAALLVRLDEPDGVRDPLAVIGIRTIQLCPSGRVGRGAHRATP